MVKTAMEAFRKAFLGVTVRYIAGNSFPASFSSQISTYYPHKQQYYKLASIN